MLMLVNVVINIKPLNAYSVLFTNNVMQLHVMQNATLADKLLSMNNTLCTKNWNQLFI